MPVKPLPPRHTTEDTIDSLIISIPSKKNLLLILFVGFWMVGWFSGETSALNGLINGGFNNPDLFMIAWLGGWTIGGIFVMSLLLWQIFGKEKIEIANHSIIYSRTVLIPFFPKEYSFEHIKNLRVAHIGYNGMYGRSRNMAFWGFGPGLIAFDYGSQTVRIGVGIDEAEAKQILAEIQQRYPQYRKQEN
jgi:hypothetical protein